MIQCWVKYTTISAYLEGEMCLFYRVATPMCVARYYTARMSTQELVNEINPCTNHSYSVRNGLRFMCRQVFVDSALSSWPLACSSSPKSAPAAPLLYPVYTDPVWLD